MDVQILNNELPKLVKTGLAVRFDIKAKISNNTFVDIEIQCRNTYDIPERSIQYIARMLSENATNDTRDYHYPKVIGIWVLGQNVTNRKSAVSEAYMTFKQNDRDDYNIMSDKARILFIELKKFKPKSIDKQHMLDAWLSFLQNPANQDVQNIDKNIEKAYEILNFVSSDERTREELILLEESRLDAESEKTNRERIAEERGVQKGLQQGIEQGKEEERRKNAIVVANKFGISVEEAENLLKK